jgi:hypothetical protein
VLCFSVDVWSATGGRCLRAALVCGFTVTACGRAETSDPNLSADGATGGKPDLFDLYPLPPDIEERARALVAELARLTCERSSSCCPRFDLAPLDDCSELSQSSALASLGGTNPSTFDFVIDEAMVSACFDAARALASRCTFADDDQLFPCLGMIQATKKGETPVECRTQTACQVHRGANYRCLDGRCLAEVEVALGADCRAAENPSSLPVCGPLAGCDSGKCAPRAAVGEACTEYPCVEGYACVAGVCRPGLSEGEACPPPSTCSLGLDCRQDSDATERCLSDPGIGGPCRFAGECTENSACIDGICKPRELSLCARPK